MEDPESEWEIQEYSPSNEGETSMVKWILKKGYGIGKKMVITGIVISSAPLVLPPLVVFSAMGVAVSVPFGLVFASYACTNKLMSMLLPNSTPPPPLMLEYYAVEDEEKAGCLLTDMELYESHDVNNHEMEGLLKNVDEIDYYSDEAGLENVVQEDDDEQMDEMMHEVDHGREYLDDENIKERLVVDKEEKGRSVDLEQGIEVRLKADEVYGNTDTEKGRFNNEIEDANEKLERENMEKEEREDLRQGDADEKSNGSIEIKIEKEEEGDALQRENIMEDVKLGVEITVELNAAGPEDESITKSGGIVDETGYEEDVGDLVEGDDDSLEEERKSEKPLAEMEVDVVKKVYHNEEEVTKNEDEDEDAEMVNGSTGLLEKIRNEESLDKHERASKEKDVNTQKPVTIKEINSQMLIVDRNTNMKPVDQHHVVEKRQVLADTDGSEDAKEISAFHESPSQNTSIISKRSDDSASKRADNAKITDTDVRFRKKKMTVDDEKIWEKIEAMRAIVGFEAPRQATCIGELKALYVFTGVEPPASFKDEADLDEVSINLKFLMSIVGVR